MQYFSSLIGILSAITFLLIGAAIKYYKAYLLISGYNTMSKEKKKNVDIDRLGKFIANISFAIAGIIIMATLFINLNLKVASGITFAMGILKTLMVLLKQLKL